MANLFFLSLFVAISTLMATEAQFPPLPINPLPGVLNSLANITGNVYCALNVTVSSNGSVVGDPPPFPNARVELRCNGTVTANTTTNGSGVFSLPPIGSALNASEFLLQLVGSCRLVVTTPLVNCNATLPAVNGSALISNLQPAIGGITNLVGTVLKLLTLIPLVFRLSLTL